MALQADEQRALVRACRKVTLAPLAAERQNRWAAQHEIAKLVVLDS